MDAERGYDPKKSRCCTYCRFEQTCPNSKVAMICLKFEVRKEYKDGVDRDVVIEDKYDACAGSVSIHASVWGSTIR